MKDPYLFIGLPNSTKDEIVSLSSNLDRITNIVCAALDVSPADLISKSRKRPFAEARCIAIGTILKIQKVPLKALCLKFGGRNHSTIIYNRDLYHDLIASDKDFKIKAEKINKLLSQKR